MKLYLTRHGETIENAEHILMGHMPGTLSTQGKEQAEKLALRLESVRFDAIYCSDLKRAIDTAQYIQKYHKDTPFEIKKEIRETDFGDWTGQKWTEVDAHNPPSNMESPAQLQQRMLDFIEKLHENHIHDTVLVITHYGCIVSLLSYFLSHPVERMLEIEQKNTALNIVEILEDKKHILHLVNCGKHLEL